MRKTSQGHSLMGGCKTFLLFDFVSFSLSFFRSLSHTHTRTPKDSCLFEKLLSSIYLSLWPQKEVLFLTLSLMEWGGNSLSHICSSDPFGQNGLVFLLPPSKSMALTRASIKGKIKRIFESEKKIAWVENARKAQKVRPYKFSLCFSSLATKQGTKVLKGLPLSGHGNLIRLCHH